MKYKHLWLFLLFALSSWPLPALPKTLLDTWILRLAPQPWQNGQYRYRVLSFWQQGQDVAYLDFVIYPSPRVRSTLITGIAWQETENILILEAQKQVQVLHEGQGFATPFRWERTEIQAKRQRKFAVIDKILQLAGEPHFTHYGQSWTTARQQNDVFSAMDLFMVNSYLLQSQIEYFGSIRMSQYTNFTQQGLISGQLYLDFEIQGFLGLGNSGLWFGLQGFEQLSHSRLEGRFFGGATNMDGQIECFLQEQPVFAVDFSKVTIKNGYADSGFYRVHFPFGKEQHIPVKRYGN